MAYLMAYGSLIHPDETLRHAFEVTNRIPVKVKDYRRLFNQKVTFRKSVGNRAAVLNISEEKNMWINGILLEGFHANFHDEIDAREAGYDRLVIPPENISYYDKNLNLSLPCYIYRGKQGAQDDSLFPIDDYLDLCLEGAKTYGEDFFEDFVHTTWVTGNRRLDSYLTQR